ncbi:MAG: hypothetical protein JWL95_1444 [Gemmatimonadetes bacterium]|nr:hypothetical protein [Gemmatimonadota bacterium]
MSPNALNTSNHGLRVISSLAALSLLSVLTLGCAKNDAPSPDTSAALLPAPSETAAAAPAASSPAATPVRGTLASLTDTMLSVMTANGEARVRIVAPLRVYVRKPSDLQHVTPSSFVGVTSVKQPDGSERATEIHIFPAELRGTGEGSRLMEQATGNSGRSTMTNGTVSGSRMTNGSVAGSRMTNGAVGARAGDSTLTVTYQGGSQTITIPARVTVTVIAPSQEKLAPGANVVVLTNKGSDGGMTTSTVMLGPVAAPK